MEAPCVIFSLPGIHVGNSKAITNSRCSSLNCQDLVTVERYDLRSSLKTIYSLIVSKYDFLGTRRKKIIRHSRINVATVPINDYANGAKIIFSRLNFATTGDEVSPSLHIWPGCSVTPLQGFLVIVISALLQMPNPSTRVICLNY